MFELVAVWNQERVRRDRRFCRRIVERAFIHFVGVKSGVPKLGFTAQEAQSVIFPGRMTNYSRQSFAHAIPKEDDLSGTERAVHRHDGAIRRDRRRTAFIDEYESGEILPETATGNCITWHESRAVGTGGIGYSPALWKPA